MDTMKFRCYIWGKDSDWQALCTDLDIAVQGSSYDVTKTLLSEAIDGFLHEVEKLLANDQNEFLNRRAPLYLRIILRTKYYLFLIRKHFREVSSKVKRDIIFIYCPTS